MADLEGLKARRSRPWAHPYTVKVLGRIFKMMASRFARAALLPLALLPGRAVGVMADLEGMEAAFKVEGEKAEKSEASASEGEASEKPTKLITAVLQPLTPFGEPVLQEAASKAANAADSDKEKARTPSLLTMQVDDQKTHMYDSKHSYV